MLLQDIIKQDAQRLQEGISELSNELDLRVEVTPAQYRFITWQMAQAENPQEMEVDIASALTYSRNLGLPLDFCLNNLDALTQVQTGLKYTPTATSFKAIANSFKVGDLGNQRGDLGDQYREAYMSGGDVTSIQAQIQDIDSQIENLQDHVPRNWITEALKMTAQTMPYTGQIIWEGVKGAAVGAGIAGIASLIPGVGPAMAGAGATAKVISAVSMLFRAKETLDIVGGNQFYDMVQDGVDPRVAYGMSYLSGGLSAAIEAWLGGLTGSAMSALGISPQKFASRVATRMYLSGTMGTLANTATQHLLTAGSEGLEEFTETLKNRLMEHIAYELSDMEAPVQDKSALSQALDDFLPGFVSSLFLGIPFTAMQGYSDYRTASSIRGDSQTILSKKAFMDKYGSKKPQGVSEEDWTRTMEGMWNEGKEARMATINERLKTQAVDIEAEPRFDDEGNLVGGGQRTYPIERTAAGNLYMQEAEAQRLPGNVSEHTLKIGSPKTGKAYGYITYRIDEDGNKLEIVSMKTYDAFTSIRKEAMQDLLRRYPDMDITWDPDADVDIALREQLMRENPQGYERGLNYGTAQDVEDKTYIMNRLGNLFSDDNAVNSGLATLVQMTARTEGMTGRAWWDRYIKDLRKMDQPGARGRIDFVEATEVMQAVIYAGEHADPTTFEHELVHLIMSIGDRKAQFKSIFDKVKDTDQFKKFVDDTRMVRTSSEALSNLFQSDEWTVADEEFLTELYEAWRTTGQTHNAELRNFFQRISEVFRRVYQAIRPYAKLNDEMVDFFESFYAAMPGAQEAETTATSTAQDVEVDTASTVAESVISEEGEAEEAVPEEAQPTASAGPGVDEDGIPYRRAAPGIRQKSYPKTVKRGRPKRLRQSLMDEDMDARYMAAVESGDIETVRRMVQERAEAMGFEDAIPEQTEAYVLRTKPAPKKTIKVYKTFTVDAQGNPTALFVAGTAKLPRGVWLDAVDTYHFTASNGRQYIPSTQNPNTAGGKTGASVEIPSEEVRQELVDRGYLSEDSKAKKITALAYRPGWHAGDEPFFPQGGIQDTEYVADEEAYAQLAKDIREQEGVSDARAKELRLERYGTFDEWRGQERTQAHPYKNLHRRNQVVFECEMSADNDYTRTTTIRSGANKGKVQYADMQEMPVDGSYRYATNPMTKASDKGVWYISGTLMIVRPLTQQEADSILVNDGFMPQGWEGGTMDLEALNVPMEQDDAARKTLAPITYDEQGNVIPLSERFNAQYANILYQTDNEYGGYDWTRGMSNRAVMAYEAGERPLSRWTKDLVKSEVEKMAGRDVARILMELPLKDLKDALLYNSSYHHTGRYFNRTDFYSINEDVASLTEEQARQFVDDYKAYTKALDDYSKAYTENARRIREAAGTGEELDLTYYSHPQAKEYTDRVTVTGPITSRYGIQQYHFTNVSEFEDERRRMMPAYDALDPAIQGFINDNFNEDDVSAGGNIYERGRKPSRSDYGNPDYFKEGERRIATSGNTLELQEYRDGAWATVVASTLPEGYSFRDIYLLARNTTPDSIIDFNRMRVAPFTSEQLTRPSRPSLPRSLFQTGYTDEEQAIVNQYKDTDLWLKAPNGEPTNLSERQWVQVRTPSFKSWFGDWEDDPENASKVLDENGEPKVVYHGTDATDDGYPFTEFEWGDGYRNKGAWFSDDMDVAWSYGGWRPGSMRFEWSDEDYGFINTGEGDLYAVFLNLRNPEMIDVEGRNWNDIYGDDVEWYYVDDLEGNLVESFDNEADYNHWRATTDLIEGVDYVLTIDVDDTNSYTTRDVVANLPSDADGVIFQGIVDIGRRGGTNSESTVYVVTDSASQIKSIDNVGTFSAENANILYQMDREYDPRHAIPKVRGGWTKDKILRYLKAHPSMSGTESAIRLIREFDSPEELKEHMFYHGTPYGTSKGLVPSMTFSERKAAQIGGGGYGERYWAISVTKNKKIASNFSGTQRQVSIYPIILAKNAVVKQMDIEDSADLDEHIVDLYTEGVDAVWVGDPDSGEQELAVINPQAIVNIGTSDIYNVFQLGTPRNPISIADDAQVERIYDYAKQHPSLRERDYGAPKAPLSSDFTSEEEYKAARKKYMEDKEEWYKTQGYMDYLAAKNERRRAILFQTAYHGSPHDFEAFSTNFMGTGEGAQMFGWGIYLSDLEEVGEHYSNMAYTVKAKSEEVQRYERMINAENRLLERFNMEYETSLTGERFKGDPEYEALASGRYDDILSPTMRERFRAMPPEEAASIYRRERAEASQRNIKATEVRLENLQSALEDARNRQVQARNLYTVEIPDDAKWLDWMKKAPRGIFKQLTKDPDFRDVLIYSYGSLEDAKPDFTGKTGAGIYGTIATIIGNDRNASELLSRIGYTGIRYPVDATSATPSATDSNYVIFNDADIRIIRHARSLYQSDSGNTSILDAEGEPVLTHATGDGTILIGGRGLAMSFLEANGPAANVNTDIALEGAQGVGLSDFTAAVIPDDLPGDQLDRLNEAGLQITSYPASDPGMREVVLQEAIKATARLALFQDTYYNGWLYEVESYAREASSFTELESYVNAMVNPFFDTPPDQDSILRDVWNSVRRGSDADYGTDISEDYYGEGEEDFDTEDYLSHAGRYSGSFTRAAKEYSIESPDQSISTQGDKDAYFVDLLDNPSQRNFLSFMKSLKDILDGVKEWNRIYGRDETGFTAEDQAQFEDLLEKSSMIENSLPLYFRNFLKSKVLEEMLDRQSKGQDPVPTDEARNSVARVMGYIRRSPRAYRGLYATISGNAYWEAVFDYAPFIEENLPADFGQLSFSERNAVVQALDNQRVKEAIRSGKEPYTNGEVERLLDEYDERIRQAQEEAADLQSQLEESQDAQSKVTSVLKGLSKQDEERKKSVIRLDRELDKASREVAQKAREVGIKDQATTAGFNTPEYRDSLRYYDSELSKLFPDPMETIRKKIKRLQDQEAEYTRTATAQRKEAQADRRVLETRWKDINRLRATVERKDSEIRAIKYRMDQKMEELKAKIDKVANEADRKLFETQLRDAQRLRDTVARNARERNDLKLTYGQKMKQIREFLEKRFDDKELTIRLGYEKRIGEMRKRHEKAIADLKQLYKERAALRKAKEYKRKLARIIMRRISANVNMEEADAIREIQAYVDPAFRSRMRIGDKESMDISTLKKLYKENPGNIIFSSLSPEKLARLSKADLNELTISELEDLAAVVNYLYRLGFEKRRAYLEARRAEVRQYQSAFINEVMSSKRYTGDNPLPGTKQQRNLDRSFRFKLASLYDSTINMDRLAQKLDGGRKGLFFDLLVRQKREHEAEQWRNTSERTKRIYDFIKEEKVDLNSLYRAVDISLPAVSSNGLDFDARMVTLTVSDLAYFYLSPGNERNVAALSYGSLVTKAEKEEVRQTFKDREDASDILNSTIRELGDQRYAQVYEVARSVIGSDPKVLALVRMIEEDFNEPGHFDRIRDLMLRVYNTEVEREDYYLPISRSEVMGEPAEKLREDVLNVVPGTKATVEQGFTKSRQDISPYNQTIASFDLFKVWQDSIYNEEHTAANLEYVRLLNGVFINRGSEALREYITQTYGSHVMEMIDTHIKQVANPKAFTDNLASNRLIRALRGNLYSAYLGFKLSTVVMQLVSSPMPFLGAVNPLELLSSYLKIMAHPNEMWDTITTLSQFMANRSFDMVPEMLRQALSQADLQKIRKKMLQIQQFGMSGLEAVDRFAVAGGWYAIYQKELAKMDGGDLAENMRKAAQVADEYVQETQPQGNITELAPLFKDKGEAVKLITAFQSALNVIWQNVTFDIPQAFKNREYGKAAGMVTGYIIAGALVYLIQEGFDDDDDDKDKMRKILYSFTTQFSAGVPLVGDMVDNLLYHFITGDKAQSFGDTFFPSADKFFKGMDKVADGDWRKAVQYILEAVSLSLGLPYSGVKELQAIEEEGIGAIFGRRG